MRLSKAEATVDAVVEALDARCGVVVERFIDDAKVAALKEELAPFRAREPARAQRLRGVRDQADLRAVRQDPWLRRARHAPAAARRARPGPRALPAQRARGIDIGPGETPQGLHRDDVVYPIPWPHPAGGAQHDVGARRLHRGQRRDPIVPGATAPPADRPPTSAATSPMPAGSVMFYVGHGVARRRSQPHRRAAPR